MGQAEAASRTPRVTGMEYMYLCMMPERKTRKAGQQLMLFTNRSLQNKKVDGVAASKQIRRETQQME